MKHSTKLAILAVLSAFLLISPLSLAKTDGQAGSWEAGMYFRYSPDNGSIFTDHYLTGNLPLYQGPSWALSLQGHGFMAFPPGQANLGAEARVIGTLDLGELTYGELKLLAEGAWGMGLQNDIWIHRRLGLGFLWLLLRQDNLLRVTFIGGFQDQSVWAPSDLDEKYAQLRVNLEPQNRSGVILGGGINWGELPGPNGEIIMQPVGFAQMGYRFKF